MIIPYGHKSLKLRGLPWVTVSIIALCIAVFVMTSGSADRLARESNELFNQIAELYLVQPSLELDPDFEDLLFEQLEVDENQREVFLESLQRQSGSLPPHRLASSQRELDALIDRFFAVYRGSPQYRFGVVPAAIEPFDLVTYQFLHGGWLHLLGNLLFLYIAGPHLEQRWGRWLYLGFYLAAGIVAALFWAVRYPGLDMPLVGASGSIAGLMGAFLVCFWSSKIKFFYWFFVVWGTFEAPAWLMGPLWLILEVISGRTMDVMSQGDGGGGVAHWAHVWGFIFGMAFAWILGLIGIDDRLAARIQPGAETEPEPERGPSGHRAAAAGPRDPGQRRSQPHWRTETVGPSRVAIEVREAGPGNDDPVADLTEPASEPLAIIDISIDTVPRVEIRPAERLRVLEVVPRAVRDGRLTFEGSDGPRQLDLVKVEAVAVGAIAGPGARPFLVIDLLLDSPTDGSGDLRVVRFRSSAFDPRTVVGGERAMEAFVRLVHILRTASSGLTLPDEETIRTPAARQYGSIDEYQGEVLGVVGHES